MSDNRKEDVDNANYESRDIHNGQSGTVSRDDAGVTSGERRELSGVEDSRPLGSEFTGGAQAAGRDGLSDSVPLSQSAAGGGTGSHSEEPGHESRRARGAGTEWYKHAGARNFIITDDLGIGKGGAKAKYQDNIAAIKLIKSEVGESGIANAEQQNVLARYVGWGGLPHVFDPENSAWADEYSELKELLTEEEYQLARGSTLNAHYTSLDVIDGIYAGLERLGLKPDIGKKLHILEPAAGIGNFVGRAPEAFRNASFTQVELDKLTAAINAGLYPDSRVLNIGFEKFRSKAGYFDAAIGNPPFGNYKVYDPAFTGLSKHTIHNYFIGKSLASVHPGGVVGMVVSRYFMDAVNPNARIDIAKMGHFLGAVRLPNTAFKENALTSVSTDVVFFQRAAPGDEPDMSWTNTVRMKLRDSGEEMDLNSYYANNPGQIIGKMAFRSGPHGPVVDCLPPDNVDIGQALIERLSALPQNIYVPADPFTESLQAEQKLKIPAPEGVTVGSFFITPDKRVARRLPDLMDEFDYEYVETRSEKDVERIISALTIRDTVKKLIKLESSPDGDESEMEELRAELNKQYDKHVKKYDFLNSRSNRAALKDEPSFPLLLSLETDYDKGISKTVALRDGVEPRKASAKKVAIFDRRVSQPQRKITIAENAKDALVISLNEYGRVDLNHMAQLTNFSHEKLQMELKGHIFFDPVDEEWIVADRYLTGNVKEKLRQAQQAQLLDNIEALQAVQPADIDAVDIAVQLGSVWVPGSDIRSFALEELGIGTALCSVNYLPALGYWIASIKGGSPVALKNTWGTERYPADELLEAIIKNAPIKVEDVVGEDASGKPIKRVNEAETTAAQGKAEEIQNRFKDWIWQNPERRERLARLYNDKFNTHVAPHYNGSHLTLPTASSVISLRAHQKNAIWRGTQEGGGLFDHVVGAGKTLVAIGTVMESRRMGLLKKPLVVVPNHLLNQWKEEFYKLYPTANILVATKDDFSKENRQRLFSHIATGDWDAVIVAHSSFKYIGMPEEVVEKFVNQQLKDIEEAISQVKNDGGDRLSIKELEKQRKRLQAKIEKSTEDVGRKDSAITFDMLGIDGLVVDEAHEFKNLKITTKMTRVAGLGNLEGSEKAMDLFMKCRYLQEKNNGRGVYFLTGTPISNTIAELYTMQRYLQYVDLQKKGVLTFDAWASTFGQIETGWELDATGVNYRLNTRFSKFTNVPELISMYRSFSDVVTQHDLAEQAVRDGSGRLVPKVAGGKPTNIIVERSDDLARYMGVQEQVIDAVTNLPAFDASGMKITAWNPGSIIYRMENLPEDRSIDNALKVTNDARLAALDYRLKDAGADDFEGSKVNVAVENIFRIWQQEAHRSGTQLVFCDLSTPKGQKTTPAAAVRTPSEDDESDPQDKDVSLISMDELLSGNSKFSVYDDIRSKLISKGVPPEEIRFIHEAGNDNKKAELFRDMNAGRARILLGSTPKMGAGTNVQKKLVALHHLDAPWRPSDLEQREGRIIRQGNEFFEQDKDGFEVQIFRYSTKQTYDARMWQTIESKAVGIEQFRRGSLTDRVIDDVVGEAANAAEMKAAATGNELIFKQVKINAEKKKQESLYNNYMRGIHQLESRIANIPLYIESTENSKEKWSQIIETVREVKNIDALDTGVTTFYTKAVSKDSDTNKANAEQTARYISSCLKKAVDSFKEGKRDSVYVGKYRGVDIEVLSRVTMGAPVVIFELHHNGKRIEWESLIRGNLEYGANSEFSISGFFTRVNNIIGAFDQVNQHLDKKVENYKSELEQANAQLLKGYPDKPYLDALRQDAIDVMKELKLMQDNAEYKSEWEPSSDNVERAVNDITVQLKTEDSNAPVDSGHSLSDGAEMQSTKVLENSMSNPDVEPVLHLEEDPDITAIREIQREQEQLLLSHDLSDNAEGVDSTLESLSTVEAILISSQSKQLIQQAEEAVGLTLSEDKVEYRTSDFAYGRVVYNTDNNRVQIYFNERPEEGTPAFDIKENLKSNGFFLSRRNNNAWQRKLNNHAIGIAEGFLGVELPKLDITPQVSSRSRGKPTVNGNSESPVVGNVLATLNQYLLNTLSGDAMFELSQSMANVGEGEVAKFWLENSGEKACKQAIMVLAEKADKDQDATAFTKWNSIGADNNIPESQYALAQQYRMGYGVEKSFIKAWQLLEKAASSGHSDATLALQDAELQYRMQIENGDKSAWVYLGDYYHRNALDPDKQNDFEAAHFTADMAIVAYLNADQSDGVATLKAATVCLQEWDKGGDSEYAKRGMELLVESINNGNLDAFESLRETVIKNVDNSDTNRHIIPNDIIDLCYDKLTKSNPELGETLKIIISEKIACDDDSKHPLEISRTLGYQLENELDSDISFEPAMSLVDEAALISERENMLVELSAIREKLNKQYPEYSHAQAHLIAKNDEISWWKREYEHALGISLNAPEPNKGFSTPEGRVLDFGNSEERRELHLHVMSMIKLGIQKAHKENGSVTVDIGKYNYRDIYIDCSPDSLRFIFCGANISGYTPDSLSYSKDKKISFKINELEYELNDFVNGIEDKLKLLHDEREIWASKFEELNASRTSMENEFNVLISKCEDLTSKIEGKFNDTQRVSSTFDEMSIRSTGPIISMERNVVADNSEKRTSSMPSQKR
ncbi:TPA: DEAD/DEAH box helicase family protein [Salmonella enterica subsp. salamae serovar 35:g,m,s,t:-]|nr:DEAD/DEAH box helicase family protein [Salmonella enterica subsp. salamae serovar 35:g,m,s,t:-]HCA3549684.1 DEAD/DEAH box helicase family protein [Salmonella enterica subsp. salamae serovar 35:g,m,s,t:-]